MRPISIGTCLVIFGCVSTADLIAAPMAFDHAESLDAWTFTNGPEFPGATGKIAWNARRGRHHPGCLELHYSFAGGGNYVQAACRLPAGNNAQRVRLWLAKPAGHRITFRATDSAQQTFQKHVHYLFPDWQQIEVDLTDWPHWFGGPADGRIRPPIRQFGILIENTCEPRQGVLLIDDVELLGPPAGDSDQPTSRYVACDFSSSNRWAVGGGPGNRLENGKWQYRFNPGQGRPSLKTDFSLPGRPSVLRLILDGDGSGHRIHVQLASHLQFFRREVGRLAGKGRQVIEVPLGDMATWQRVGGRGDGQVRLPLRVRGIGLERTGAGPASGAITLKRIETDTALPAGRKVLLVPDVQHTEDQVRFSVRLRNLRATEAKGRLVCELCSLAERIERKAVELTLPPAGAQPTAQAFHFPLGRHHFLEAVFRWVEPGSISPPVSIGMSTVPPEPAPASLDPQSPIGVGLYLYRWHHDHRAHERMAELARLARRAGVKWTREQIDWGLIEPEEGRYDWAFYDDLVDVARDHGISICGLLCYWSPYAKAYTPQGIDQYCRWVRQVVRRYRSRIKHWEIWNEPNIFFWSGPKELYATLLARAYETIKAEDPDAQVLGCSTSGIDKDFIRKTMSRGGVFDALAIHPYRGALNDLQYIRELQEAQGLVGGRSLWITEVGWASHLLTGRSEREQASLVARVYLASLASEVAANIYWYDFRNDGADPYYHELNFGLVRSDFRPKPGYRALAAIGRTLDGLSVKQPIDVGPDAYAFRFGNDRRDVIAACAPDAGRILTFETADEVRISNAVGEGVEPTRNGNHMSLTLDTGFPVYVTSGTGFAFKPLDPAVRLDANKTAVRPGEQVDLRFRPVVGISRWDLPFGWSVPVKIGPDTYRLAIPAEAPTGRAELQAIVEGTALRLPLVLSLQPAVIRL